MIPRRARREMAGDDRRLRLPVHRGLQGIRRGARPRVSFAANLAVTLVVGSYAGLEAQSEGGLAPGDVVRVDRDFVGTLMSIDDQAR